MRYPFFLAAALLCCAGVGRAQGPAFDRTVAPLFIDRCIDCHSGPRPKGKLDLTKKAASSRAADIWQRIDAGEMPPKKPLAAKEKAIVKAWVDSGAAWGTDPIDPFRVTTASRAGYDWWALQPVQRPEPPVVRRKDWPRNPIDQFILAKLEAEGLTPSPEADARTRIRRLTFDLIGLPPSPADVDAFVQRSAKGPAAARQATADLVDKLLASPHHGERWARHWLDVVRFGESNGFEHDELRKNAWPYRDWVIAAINRDMRYDEFARLQIAGDVLKKDDPEAITATGFLVAGGYDSVGQGQQSAAMKAVVRQDELEDIVGTIGQTFLGLTVQCARCHDHKFDPVRIDEYYRLTAAVAGVRHGERDIATAASKASSEKSRLPTQRRLDAARAAITEIDAPVRAKILAARKQAGKLDQVKIPGSLARWDFTRSLADEVGGLAAQLHGGATRTADGLVLLGGKSYASTPPLAKPLAAKTLVADVRLTDLTQRGGGVVSVQSLDGALFDAIAFAEREPGRWLAGSDFFRRTQDLQGPAESAAGDVRIAIAYHADGSIQAYRNGAPYGKPYKVKTQQAFAAEKSMVLFGLRHSPPGGNRHFTGVIRRAEVFDRALTAEELAAVTGNVAAFVTENEINQNLDVGTRMQRFILLKQVAEIEASLSSKPATNRAYAVVPRGIEKTHLLIRGNPAQPGPLLAPGGVAALRLPSDFGAAEISDAERRVKLADWITDARNPLFARVMVNRLWHYHFGVGLVDTPSDFGFNGGRPSHPELLDWLAAEFVASGYSMKHMHRLIVTSATYSQAAKYRSEAAKRDAANRWLWRKSPNRIEAEALRDAILSVTGQLNLQQGGPGYQDFKLTIRGATHYYNPIDADEPSVYRRSIYRTWARSGRNGLLDAHDCPDPSTTSPRRALTTTPLQALALMNNAFVLRMADRFAERLKKEAGGDVGRQIDHAYRLAYGRPPAPEEIALVRPVIERHGLPAFCRAIFNSNEFVYID